MMDSIDNPDIGPGRALALIAAALVLNIAEIVLIGVILACMAIQIAALFQMIEHTPWKIVALVAVSIIIMTVSMVAISTRNIPFLCKQFGSASAQAAKISANVGATIWTLAALFIYLTAHDHLSIGVFPIYAGLLGGAAMQLFMGYRRGPSLRTAQTPIATDLLIQPKDNFDAVVQLLDKPADSTLDGNTITLPTADEIKREL